MGPPEAPHAAVAEFQVAVDEYVELHRRLERRWHPVWLAGEEMETAADELRRELRDAPLMAGAPRLFNAGVAGIFREKVGDALRKQGYNVEALAEPEDEEAGGGWGRPIPYEWLDPRASRPLWPLPAVLPVLPLELEYRLVGRDLVLLDVEANMAVDVLDLVPEPPWNPHDEEPMTPEDRFMPGPDEAFGCLYGDVMDYIELDDHERRDRIEE
jgi:hypothetical protein